METSHPFGFSTLFAGTPTAINSLRLLSPEGSLVRHLFAQPPCQPEEPRTWQRVSLPVYDDDRQHPTPGYIFRRRNLSKHSPEGREISLKVDHLDLGDEIRVCDRS